MTDGDNNNRVCFEWHGIMASHYVRTVPLELHVEGIQLRLALFDSKGKINY